jgi:hypothetical protein
MIYLDQRGIHIGETAAFYVLKLEQNYAVLVDNPGQFDQALEAYERALQLAYQLDQPIVAAEIQVSRTVALKLLSAANRKSIPTVLDGRQETEDQWCRPPSSFSCQTRNEHLIRCTYATTIMPTSWQSALR